MAGGDWKAAKGHFFLEIILFVRHRPAKRCLNVFGSRAQGWGSLWEHSGVPGEGDLGVDGDP